MAAKPKGKRSTKKKSAKKKTWTASELLQLPQERQDAILEAAAALAEEEYRTNPELNFDLYYESGLNGGSSHNAETR
jgi:hypothetical protein